MAAVASNGGEEALQERERARKARWEAIASELLALMAEAHADLALVQDFLAAQDYVARRAVRPSRADRLLTKPDVATADYYSGVALAGATVRALPLEESAGFQPDLDAVAGGPDPALTVLNSPSNPCAACERPGPLYPSVCIPFTAVV